MQESVEYNSMCGIKNNLHNVNQIYTGLWLCSMWLCSKRTSWTIRKESSTGMNDMF